VRVCLQGHQPFAAAVEAVRATLTALRNGTQPGDLQGLASAETMAVATDAARYQKDSDAWL
jgi:carboxyvinyl-carboxyphosphonate phosphorylmutase